MAILFFCPNCPTKLRAKNKEAGKEFTCYKCGHVTRVPYEEQVDVDERARRREKRRGRAELAERLGLLDIGLLIHYGNVALFLLTPWVYWLGFSVLSLAHDYADMIGSLRMVIGRSV